MQPKFSRKDCSIFGWNTWKLFGQSIHFGILWQNRICDHLLTLPPHLTIYVVSSTDFHSLSSIFFERRFKIFFFFQFCLFILLAKTTSTRSLGNNWFCNLAFSLKLWHFSVQIHKQLIVYWNHYSQFNSAVFNLTINGFH